MNTLPKETLKELRNRLIALKDENGHYILSMIGLSSEVKMEALMSFLGEELSQILADYDKAVIETTKEIFLVKDENGVVDTADDYVRIREELRAEQRQAAKAFKEGLGS